MSKSGSIWFDEDGDGGTDGCSEGKRTGKREGVEVVRVWGRRRLWMKTGKKRQPTD